MNYNTELDTNTKALDSLADMDIALVIHRKAEEEVEQLEQSVGAGHISTPLILDHLSDIRMMLWGAEDIYKKQLEEVRIILDNENAIGLTEKQVTENISTINKRFDKHSKEIKELKSAMNKALNILEVLSKGVS